VLLLEFLNLIRKNNVMGLTYADIELINAGDIAMARKFVIGEEDIKRMNVNILVDTGAYNLCINETIQEQLDLLFLEKRKGQLANGSIEEYDLVGPIVLKFKNRQTVCNALVLKGENEPLLGAIPLEDLDVIIHPLSQQLMVNPDHPNYAQMKLK
jgi:clan AA aspartic protease